MTTRGAGVADYGAGRASRRCRRGCARVSVASILTPRWARPSHTCYPQLALWAIFLGRSAAISGHCVCRRGYVRVSVASILTPRWAAWSFSHLLPTACAVGYILGPLRGDIWTLRLPTWVRPSLCRKFLTPAGLRLSHTCYPQLALWAILLGRSAAISGHRVPLFERVGVATRTRPAPFEPPPRVIISMYPTVTNCL